MKKQPFTILLHIALVIILAGAIVTHFFGVQGTIRLEKEGIPTDRFDQTSGPGDGTLPFHLYLDDVEILYYPGTTTPMDFKSRLKVNGKIVDISMNNVGEVEGWRFYQTGIGGDHSVISISHDPWGIGITYLGYILLGLGMIGFFFQKNTPWRGLLRKKRGMAAMTILLLSINIGYSAELPVMQRPLAANFGKVYVYWNDRVAPMQTMAVDVTRSLYGGDNYQGFTSEQVLSGWLFYFDEWHRDYLEKYPEVGHVPENPTGKKEKKLLEKIGLIQLLGTGEAFRIYPYRSVSGNMEWLSLTGRRPSAMSLEQWTFMQTTMPRMKGLLLEGKNIRVNEELDSLKAGQIKYAGKDVLPSEGKLQAERFYNRWASPGLAGVVTLLISIITIGLSIRLGKSKGKLRYLLTGITSLLFLYVGSVLGLLWWLSGHLPLSNGPETMLFMGLVALAGALLSGRNLTLKCCLCGVAGMALLVAAMGGRTPRVGMLMPVLSSPLLSLHVMIVMISYVLFMLMALLSGIGLCSRLQERKESLSVTCRLLLTPAVCLLGVGIFIGAVWANQSWGRYWGWDPKETCALITWFIYSIPVHWGSRRLACFRKPKVLHTYLLLAILSVLFTYFGANYLLPGLHSYA